MACRRRITRASVGCGRAPGRGRARACALREGGAEPPSSGRGAALPLRYGAFGVTASRRRGKWRPCLFAVRCGHGAASHRKETWHAHRPGRLARIWVRAGAGIRERRHFQSLPTTPTSLTGQPCASRERSGARRHTLAISLAPNSTNIAPAMRSIQRRPRS
jgi:hypothetical protein